jgi:hypothetical protein
VLAAGESGTAGSDGAESASADEEAAGEPEPVALAEEPRRRWGFGRRRRSAAADEALPELPVEEAEGAQVPGLAAAGPEADPAEALSSGNTESTENTDEDVLAATGGDAVDGGGEAAGPASADEVAAGEPEPVAAEEEPPEPVAAEEEPPEPVAADDDPPEPASGEEEQPEPHLAVEEEPRRRWGFGRRRPSSTAHPEPEEDGQR